MAVGQTNAVSTVIFENLFYLYMAIAILVGGLVLGWLGYILVKYRAREDGLRPADAPRIGYLPAERGHPMWSYVMAILIGGIMFGLAFSTISAVTTLEVPPPAEEHLNVEIVGFQFGWRMVFRGEGGIPMAKINDWTTPVDTAVVANVTSQDVWHNFALPPLRIRIDVVPGQVNHIWWKAHEIGDIDPVCVQLCGNGHAIMRGTMHIVSKEEFAVYLADETQKEYARLERANPGLNVTFDGARFLVEDREIDTTRAFALRVVNQAASEHTFAGPHGEIALAAGESGLVYLPEGGGEVRALGTSAVQGFGSVG
jgi:cytochrome c oxidase subunit 2